MPPTGPLLPATSHMNCSVCLEFPDICKNHNNGRIPSTCTEFGTRFQTNVAWKHHMSSVHKACLEARRKRELYKAKSTDHPMINAVVTANAVLCSDNPHV